eukprot:gnl/MRDRNA2_/MRDRNA2_98395_c0_seq1.p1 gnl/MRDRNA2_/MRDRNA2_98395_c0~~gnl/MRDRNA2_/MRDRNA2_98395_c0_seq1.p1  ORF type:complete len:629 (+),score=141.04 gnl/MRDRNA2_/MRDRNA2_98395_c0_seq1:78-1964(+)
MEDAGGSGEGQMVEVREHGDQIVEPQQGIAQWMSTAPPQSLVTKLAFSLNRYFERLHDAVFMLPRQLLRTNEMGEITSADPQRAVLQEKEYAHDMLEAYKEFQKLLDLMPEEISGWGEGDFQKELEILNQQDAEVQQEVDSLSDQASDLLGEVKTNIRELCSDVCGQSAAFISLSSSSSSAESGAQATDSQSDRLDFVSARLLETRVEQKQRFIEEAEFVQALANPAYIHWLATQGFLEDSAFIRFLEYLRYWEGPPWVEHLAYPQCLRMLDMLQNASFRGKLRRPEAFQILQDQMMRMWANLSEIPIESEETCETRKVQGQSDLCLVAHDPSSSSLPLLTNTLRQSAGSLSEKNAEPVSIKKRAEDIGARFLRKRKRGRLEDELAYLKDYVWKARDQWAPMQAVPASKDWFQIFLEKKDLSPISNEKSTSQEMLPHVAKLLTSSEKHLAKPTLPQSSVHVPKQQMSQLDAVDRKPTISQPRALASCARAGESGQGREHVVTEGSSDANEESRSKKRKIVLSGAAGIDDGNDLAADKEPFVLSIGALQGRWVHSIESVGSLTVQGKDVIFAKGGRFQLDEEQTKVSGRVLKITMKAGNQVWSVNRTKSTAEQIHWVDGQNSCYWKLIK